MANQPKQRHARSRAEYWKKLFNDFAKFNDEHRVSGWSPSGLVRRLETYRRCLPGLGLPSGGLVLDLGCGSGAYTRLLADSGMKVIGADYAWKVAATTRAKIPHESVGLLAADALDLPFRSDSFSHVVCIGLFQSIDDQSRVLSEILRVMAPRGTLFLMTLNARLATLILERTLGREDVIFVDGRPQPRLKTYDPDELCSLMEDIGFRVDARAPVQIYPGWLNFFGGMVAAWNWLPGLSWLTARSFRITAFKPEAETGLLEAVATNHEQVGWPFVGTM